MLSSITQSRYAKTTGRVLAAVAGIGLLVTCVYLLINGRPEVASWPAVCAGVLGYVLIRPGKRSARVNVGGVVVDIVSDDTGLIRTGIESAVTRITQREISEKTIAAARGNEDAH